jgi:peroxiredoxin
VTSRALLRRWSDGSRGAGNRRGVGDVRVAWAVSGLAATSAGVAWVALYQSLQQYGRLSVRLDKLDERLGALSAAGLAEPPEPEGVPVGAALPPFRLPDLTGRTVASDEFIGKRVLLVHWSTSCSFCDTIAADLSGATGKLRKRNTELVLVSSGDAGANHKLAEEHGFDCPVLLDDEDHPVEAFATVGTPAAYLIDEEGRVVEGLVLGADKVPQLLEEAMKGRVGLSTERPVSASRIERDGLKPGTSAPAFELPTIDGEALSLADLRGQRVILVFSDPQCGPCNELAPVLARLQGEARERGIALVMVGRGDVEENRRKRDAQGIEFSVVVQRGWRLSREYGIFATPVAFAIDEGGRIARAVAKGPEEILTLIQEELAAQKEAPMRVR